MKKLILILSIFFISACSNSSDISQFRKYTSTTFLVDGKPITCISAFRRFSCDWVSYNQKD